MGVNTVFTFRKMVKVFECAFINTSEKRYKIYKILYLYHKKKESTNF